MNSNSTNSIPTPFEKKIQLLLEKTKKKVHTCSDIINKYNIYNVNHMIMYNNDKYFICFNDNWSNNSISPEGLNNFIASVNIIAGMKQMRGIGIIISNKSFNYHTKMILETENNKYNIGTGITTYYSISDLSEEKLLNKVQTFLHSHNIWMYDEDGDCIMGII